MKKSISIIFVILSLISLIACQVKLWPDSQDDSDRIEIKVERYDRLQSRYLTTGDYSALQSMNTNYPMETRTLIENVLQLGTVDQHDINEKFLKFYQDTTLQTIIAVAETQYANMDDINTQLSDAFTHLKREIPDMEIPEFYAQIGALDQSVIVGNSSIGICLDKYLGEDFAAYKRYYPEHQRASMTRSHIVPDCLTFYILSLYPLENFDSSSQEIRDEHIGRVMYIVNRAIGKNFYDMPYVKKAEKFYKAHPKMSVKQLLQK